MVQQQRVGQPARPRFSPIGPSPQRGRPGLMALWGLRILSLATAALLVTRAIASTAGSHPNTDLLPANARVLRVEQRVAGQVDGLYEPPSPRYKTEVVLRFAVQGVEYEGSPQGLVGYLPWQTGQEVVVYHDRSDPARFCVSPAVRYSAASYLVSLTCLVAVQGVAEYLVHRRKKNRAS